MALGQILRGCLSRVVVQLCSPAPKDSSASRDEAQGLHCVPGVLSIAEGCTAIWGDLLLPWINQCLCPALAAGFKRLAVVQGACAGFRIV